MWMTDGHTLARTNTTLTPGWVATGDVYSMLGWARIPLTVATEMTLLEGVHSSLSSRMTLKLRTDFTLRMEAVNDDGSSSGAANTSFTVTPGALAFIRWRKNGTGVNYNLAVTGAGSQSLSVSFTFATSPDRWTFGGKDDGTQRCDGVGFLYWCVTHSDPSTGELTSLYNGGVPTDPQAILGDCQVVFPFINDDVPTTGTGALTSQCEPTFVDDSAYRGVAWTPSAFGAVPASRNVSSLPKNGDVDILMCSDSFGYTNRLTMSYHLANEIARFCNTNIKGLVKGWDTVDNEDSPIHTSFELTGADVESNAIDDNDEYVWGGDNGRLALPLGRLGLSVYAGTDPEGDILNIYARNTDTSYTGPLTEWAADGNTLRFAPLLRIPATDALGDISLSDGGSGDTDFAIEGDAGHVNAPAYKDCVSSAGLATCVMGPAGGSWGTAEEYLNYLGCIVDNRSVSQGVRFGVIADSSWSVAGHSVNTASSTGSATTRKRYSDAQVQHLVSAFHPDDSRKLVICLYIAMEFDYRDDLEDFVTRWDARLAAEGITNYCYLFISPHFHSISGTTEPASIRDNFRQNIVKMDEMAEADERIVCIHQYILTNGNYFTVQSSVGLSPNGADDPQQAWLEAYDDEYGTDYATTPGRNDILDTGALHLDSVAGAQLMAEMVARIISEDGSSGANRGVQGGVQGLIQQGVQQFITS